MTSENLSLILIIFVFFFLVILSTGCSQEKHITIPGECGVVMGALINKINTEEDCRVQCLNECLAIEHELSRSIFIQINASGCNSCECYCKK